MKRFDSVEELKDLDLQICADEEDFEASYSWAHTQVQEAIRDWERGLEDSPAMQCADAISTSCLRDEAEVRYYMSLPLEVKSLLAQEAGGAREFMDEYTISLVNRKKYDDKNGVSRLPLTQDHLVAALWDEVEMWSHVVEEAGRKRYSFESPLYWLGQLQEALQALGVVEACTKAPTRG